MSALVRVHGTRVTVQLRNRTTHETFTKTLTMRAPDVSSANWIAEAPITTVDRHESYVPLTDFGDIRFADAHATIGRPATPARSATGRGSMRASSSRARTGTRPRASASSPRRPRRT